MSLDLLKDDIKNKKIRKLYLFFGPEEFLKKYYVESLERILLSDEFKSLNRIVLEGKQDFGKLTDYCETLPVFSDRKLIIVKNSGLFKPKKKEGDVKKAKPHAQGDELAAFIQDLPEHVCLVFYEPEVDKRLKTTLENIKKNGLTVEFEYQRPDELIRWVSRKFRASGREINSSTAAKLVESCEQGMTEILNEVDKLLAYTEGHMEITPDDIEKVCTKSIKSRIFDLTDAIAEKKSARALGLLNDMIILKEPVPKILFMIAKQFRQTLQVRLLQEEGCGLSEIASRTGMSTYIAGKILKQASNYSKSMLKKAVETSLEMDLAVKTGKIEDRMAAELLIIEFSK
jgi:DNA polymerase III subunit delta